MQESKKIEQPPSTADEQAVHAVLLGVLDTIGRSDKAAMCALLDPLGWAAHSRDGRVFHERLWDLPERLPEAGRIEERIYDPLVHVDDDIAMIWCAYDVYLDGEPQHWGTNIVSFIKKDGRWRICGITDNGRSGPRPVDLPARGHTDGLEPPSMTYSAPTMADARSDTRNVISSAISSGWTGRPRGIPPILSMSSWRPSE
jgi:hypothetical protein